MSRLCVHVAAVRAWRAGNRGLTHGAALVGTAIVLTLNVFLILQTHSAALPGSG